MVKRRILNRDESASSAAERWLRDEGLEVPDRPRGDLPPTLPDDLTDLDDPELMQLFAEFTEWLNFADVRRTALEIDEADVQAALDVAEARAKVSGWDDDEAPKSDRRVTIAKARQVIDAEVIRAHEEFRKVKSRRKMVNAMCDILERNAALVSRELSRRIGRADITRRSERWRA